MDEGLDYLINHNDSFTEISSIVGEDLRWSCGRTSILYTALDKKHVMAIKRVPFFGDHHTFPLDVRCHGFKGTVIYEWHDREPSRLELFKAVLLNVFMGIRLPAYEGNETLRNDQGFIAVLDRHPEKQDLQFEIILSDNRYQVRNHSQKKILQPCQGFFVSAADEDVILTEKLDKGRPTMMIHRLVNKIEAVLLFSFLHSMDLRDDNSD